MQFGIGTYIRELTDALLKKHDIIIYLVSYKDSSVKELNVIKVSERYFQIRIPLPCNQLKPPNDFDRQYASVITKLLSGFIPCSGVIFQMNYIDDLPLIEILKERYPHPIVSVLHFFQWEELFNGNIKKLNHLNFDNPSNNIEYTIHIEKRMYEISDHVIVINPFMRDFIVEKYKIKASKISLIRNGIDFNKFQKLTAKAKNLSKQRLGFNSKDKIILFSGRIDPDKGVFFLSEAFIEACKVRNDLRLVFAGQGSINELLLKNEIFAGRITFTGYLSPEKLSEYYQIADIGVVPSIYEPCSYSRLEMIASGIPLILSKIIGFNEMTDDECLFINPCPNDDGEISFDTHEFCKAILLLTDNVNLAKKISANAYESMIKLHEASVIAEEMANLYNNLIKKSA